MYLCAKNEKAIVIDPFVCESAFDELESKNIDIDYIFLTHEHYDHISGVNWLKERYPGSTVIFSKNYAIGMADPKINYSRYFDSFAEFISFGKDRVIKAKVEDYACYPDMTFENNDLLEWQGHEIILNETPGHSRGSIFINVDDKLLFSGDTIFKDFPIQTKFIGGSIKDFNMITKPFINTIQKDIRVMPGHLGPFFLNESYDH
jgi:glyoxylase-like metal-dependent hydrolase (beta-lactamase superfamily II)